jgi:hypothetical protein
MQFTDKLIISPPKQFLMNNYIAGFIIINPKICIEITRPLKQQPGYDY